MNGSTAKACREKRCPRGAAGCHEVDDSPRLGLDLERERFGTVIWATGFRPDYSWLHVPALDRKGRLRHEGGVVDVPGLYALGLNFMRRRKSSFIHGAEDDVRDIATHLVAYLQQRKSVRADAPDTMARSQDPWWLTAADRVADSISSTVRVAAAKRRAMSISRFAFWSG